ncbi:inner membrane protein [Silvimonas terrae]|uniref:Inner membrane protein n=1 Tax=Silvimonas terrae TaxID=300266 RepID=A0A840RN88_9NEIS|nr:metal-dependent hydrolase [Silvimonas terrae]MBB5193633.1 inner membrane protein [Silvimonas terrae]
MTTIVTHAVVAATLVRLLPRAWRSTPLYVPAMFGAMAPDLDTLGLTLGVPYGSPYGHRGATHSLLFALLLGGLMALWLARRHGAVWRNWAILSACVFTHPIMDALTNGGRGVAFFWPLSDARFFLPVHPIMVSPIGARFFSARGALTMESELLWVWLPCLLIWLALTLWPATKRR